MPKKGEIKLKIPARTFKKLYYKDLLSLEDIGRIYGCSGGAVGNYARFHNLKLRGDGYPKGKYGRGKKHWAYKGGRYEKEGYIFIHKPDHPKAKHNRGYVREHVLVMEKHLGRELLKGEVIHHLDGNRGNNEVSNLELAGSQSEHIIKHKDKSSGKFTQTHV